MANNTGLTVGLIVLFALFLGSLLGFLIPIKPTTNTVPSNRSLEDDFPPCKDKGNNKGFPVDNTTDCRYSTQEVVDYILGLDRFYKRVLKYDQLTFVYGCNFDLDFGPDYSKLGVYPLASNPDYQEAVALRNLAISIKADPAVTTLEKIEIDKGLSDIEYYVNLSRIDHFVNQFGDYVDDYSWTHDRIIQALEMADTLAELPIYGFCNGLVAGWGTADPVAFDTRVMQWMSHLEAMIIDYQASWQHQVDVNKTHAQITFDFQTKYYWDYFSRDFQVACVALHDGSLVTQCKTYGVAANAAMANFASFFNTTYLPACLASRPNSSPGLIWIQDGDEAYQTLLMYIFY